MKGPSKVVDFTGFWRRKTVEIGFLFIHANLSFVWAPSPKLCTFSISLGTVSPLLDLHSCLTLKDWSVLIGRL